MEKTLLHTVILSLCSGLAGGAFVWALTASQRSEVPATANALPALYLPASAASATAPPTPPSKEAPLTTGLSDFRSAASDALDAVVHVRTSRTVTPKYGWYDWSGLFQTPAPQQVPSGSGSGVILSEAGYIITNHHVINGADVIEVGLNDNRTLKAELVGTDPTTDIAVLKISTEGLSTLDWGDSDAVQVGDWVLAVGNPFDLTSTVTAGIVSAKARDIQLLKPDFDRSLFPVESFIQTDAAVNPGNSGGALVDAQGALIGINTAIASRTGSYTGYAFAVPANLAQKVARDLIEFGNVQRAFLGVNIRPVDEDIADELALPEVSGVLVAGVTDGSGARNAGMEPGDVIVSVGGTPTPTVPQLLERVNRYRPGQSALVQVWRHGQLRQLDVELGAKDGVLASVPSEPDSKLSNASEADKAEAWGGTVQAASGGEEGVTVRDAGQGAMSRAGVEEGTTIVSVNGTPTPDLSAFKTAKAKAESSGQKGILLEAINADGETVWYGLSAR
ncbi:MAG: trypsin-like peptidase domain-containing protein [Flavobacteriales bacterium]|nr:trypsin-like peptidase domain-containing protein [Flavobacteriales bacterium]